MKNKLDLALSTATQTIYLANSVIQTLDGAETGQISMAPRQAGELQQLIRVFRQHLETTQLQAKQSQAEVDVQLLAARCFELDEAVRFIQRSFVIPRKFGSERQILEAADWLCVEGFRMFVAESAEQPVGPLVAIESSYCPVIWPPDARLPIPALFKVKPTRLDRDGKLPEFPVICLPGHLTHQPDLLPLLSHEVGHAVDFANETTESILSGLEPGSFHRHWCAWMRELVADAVGVTISGEAFLVALIRYLDLLRPFDDIRDDYPYPPNRLRFAFVGAMLKDFNAALTVDKWIPQDEEFSKQDTPAAELLQGFRVDVLPLLREHVFRFNDDWANESEQVQKIASSIAESDGTRVPDAVRVPFRLLPSAVTIASQLDRWDKTNEELCRSFRDLHAAQSAGERPAWVGGASQWVFSEDHLPSLRPTLLGGDDGDFKVPPLVLLTTHQRVAFVGATNWQLADQLSVAFEARGNQPWDELLVFFADEALLGKIDTDQSVVPAEGIDKLKAILSTSGWAKKWSIYEFDGPPVFGSFWDWEQPGGRIHISSALRGTDIGRCPAEDLVWIREHPSSRFQSYVRHLKTLTQTATCVTANEAEDVLRGTCLEK